MIFCFHTHYKIKTHIVNVSKIKSNKTKRIFRLNVIAFVFTRRTATNFAFFPFQKKKKETYTLHSHLRFNQTIISKNKYVFSLAHTMSLPIHQLY